jgi:hypothetical protein
MPDPEAVVPNSLVVALQPFWDTEVRVPPPPPAMTRGTSPSSTTKVPPPPPPFEPLLCPKPY